MTDSSKENSKITKIDLGPGENCKEGFTPSWFDLDVFPYPISDSSVDEYWMSHVLEHLNNPLEALREIARTLKPNGRVTIKVPHYSARGAWMNMEHKRPYALDSIDSLLTADGARFLPVKGLKVLSKRFHYSCSNYRPGKKPRFHERILDFIANIHPRWFERLCVYWFGGYEEIEIVLVKE